LLREVRVLLRLPAASGAEARAILAALSADDWAGKCDGVATSASEGAVVVEVFRSCHPIVPRLRALVDDVLRVVRPVEDTSEKLK